MQHKRRLGKGIDDISHFFLSPTPSPDLKRQWPGDGPATGTPGKLHRVIGVANQTAGVPEFFWSSQLASALSRFGKKVLVVDVGTEPERLSSIFDSSVIHPTLNELLRQPDRAITVEGPGGCRVLGFRIQLGELDQLNQDEREILFQILGMEEDQADILLLNLQLNMNLGDLFSYIQSLDEAVFIVSPQKLLGSYCVLKAFFSIRPDLRVNLVEYGTSQGTNREGIHRLAFASMGFLQRSPVVLGSVPVDTFLAANGPSLVFNNESLQAQALVEIAERILEDSGGQEKISRGLFFEQIESRWHHESKIGEERRAL